MKGQRMK